MANIIKLKPEVLSALADELGITLESLENTNDLLKELKPFWEEYKFSKLPKHKGKIKTMLPNGKAGFITSKDERMSSLISQPGKSLLLIGNGML